MTDVPHDADMEDKTFRIHLIGSKGDLDASPLSPKRKEDSSTSTIVVVPIEPDGDGKDEIPTPPKNTEEDSSASTIVVVPIEPDGDGKDEIPTPPKNTEEDSSALAIVVVPIEPDGDGKDEIPTPPKNTEESGDDTGEKVTLRESKKRKRPTITDKLNNRLSRNYKPKGKKRRFK